MKYEFAGSQWFAALHAIICERATLASVAHPDLSWSVCEVFTEAPDHIATMLGRRTAWHADIRGASVAFGLGERDNVDFKAVADYESVLPLGRYDSRNDPLRSAELQTMAQELIRDGRLKLIGVPLNPAGPLGSLHDAIARLTV